MSFLLVWKLISMAIIDSVRPLCEATSNLLKPIDLHPQDRFFIDVDKKFTRFTIRPDFHAPTSATDQWIDRFPEHSYLGGGLVKVPTTDISALVMTALFPDPHRTHVDKHSRDLLEYLALSFIAQTVRAEKQADFKNHGLVDFVDSTGIMAPYQCVATDCSIGSEFYALFMEQGTGKTLVTIRRVDHDAERKDGPYRTIVIFPNALKLNWESEIRKFSTCDSIGIFPMRTGSGRMERIKTIIEAAVCKKKQVYVLASYEELRGTIEQIVTLDWDLGVLDESHYIKNHLSLRAKNSTSLREKCKSRMILTGSPILNHPGDLFAQLEFLTKGGSGFSSNEAFKNFYMSMVQTGPQQLLYIGNQNVPLLQERLARMSFLITKKEALKDLPPKVYDIVTVEMTEEQNVIYNDVARTLQHELEGATITTNNILTKMLRLAQITSGFVPLDKVLTLTANADGSLEESWQEAEVLRIDPNPKLESLIELLKKKDFHEKTIVWACWQQDIKTISARLKIEGIEAVSYYGLTKPTQREEHVVEFNENPACKVFVGNAACAGVGLNLLGNSTPEHACDHVIYYSQDWSAGKRMQSEDRAHRRGTKRTVRITDLCIPGTIDTEIRDRVTGKRLRAKRIQDIRELLARVTSLESVKTNGDT